MNEHQKALRSHRMWFGSYKRSGELKKLPVWCFVKDGRLEFLTGGDSYKAKRVSRNPSVVCYLGAENGPTVQGRAELVSDPGEIWRGYRAYWRTHRLLMLGVGWSIRRRIRSGGQVLLRVTPVEPNPLSGLTDPAP
jgi:hypothetical protein